MGFHSNKFAGRGTLYLLTRDEEPFCGECPSFQLLYLLEKRYC